MLATATETLPTHLALLTRRLKAIGGDASGDTFLAASYLIEATIKTIAVAMQAGLESASPHQGYRIGFNLVRADSLGAWEQAIAEMTSPPVSSVLPVPFAAVTTWLGKRRTRDEDLAFREIVADGQRILELLGVDRGDNPEQKKMRGLLSLCVRIRNKTKAHGAVGPDFFAAANKPYCRIADYLLSDCPLWQWKMCYLMPAAGKQMSARLLLGHEPGTPLDRELPLSASCEGVYLLPGIGNSFIRASLIAANRELSTFLFPNGDWSDASSSGEFIDYATGKLQRRDCHDFSRVPAPLPASHTEGSPSIEVHANVFGNIPHLTDRYVRRRALERELEERLLDTNHTIITLHGVGGVGKTSLALWAAHALSERENCPFEQVLWFSARDIDLLATGPVAVRQAISTTQDVAKAFARWFGGEPSNEALAACLRGKSPALSGPTLFIFDNFETMQSPRELHEFLSIHTHIPNKVLLTSRQRAFKADWPIEVKGMGEQEAEAFIIQTARRLQAEGLFPQQVWRKLYQHSEGHPYVMQVLVGEIAAAGRYQDPPRVLSQRHDIVDALFERSFRNLSDDGRWVFLIISNWRSAIPEISLWAVGIEAGRDVLKGADECLRLSLISEVLTPDSEICYEAPQIARAFGKKKLVGDPDRLLVQEHISVLQRLGGIERGEKKTTLQVTLERYFTSCIASAARMEPAALKRTDKLLSTIAERWPSGWKELAEFRYKAKCPHAEIDEAIRRAVEEQPNEVALWQRRATYARAFNDEQTEMACWISAVEASPGNVTLISEAANRLNQLIGAIPHGRRSFYLASVRERMEHLAKRLDATGRSRLGWLYLHEGDAQKARHHAEEGLKLDGDNQYCRRLWEKVCSQIPAS